jgi:hypothetical protein
MMSVFFFGVWSLEFGDVGVSQKHGI